MEDATFVSIWLAGRGPRTRSNYAREAVRLQASLGGTPLCEATLEQLQRHLESMAHLAPRSRGLAISAIRSLYGFHVLAETLARDPARALKAPKIPDTLAERILGADDIAKLIYALEDRRDRVVLALLYSSGIRASELCGLYWRHVVPRGQGGQVTVHGKGGKSRAVLLPHETYGPLVALRGNAGPTAPVFASSWHPERPMGQRTLLRVIKRAAAAAGLSDKVSGHWLRHAHASHALDAGCPITILRDTLGHASIATTNRYAHARPDESSASFLGRKQRPEER